MADIVNYYDELLAGDHDASLSEIQKKLKDIQLQLSFKVLRPGSQQEDWKRQLVLIDQALVVFADEDSRERYDVELHRAGAPTEAEVKDIDWTSRAWIYYFGDDNGAALVASRKAKEQSPKSPMPFVVSGWVQMADREWKTAKQDADEAFVLDDQVQDSVDVQLIRGAAYLNMGRFEHKADPSDDFNRALTSFDKALLKASPGEKAEIYRWQGYTHEAMKNYQAMLTSGMSGLSVGTELPDSMRHNLEKITSDAINYLSLGEVKAAIRTLETQRKAVVSSSIFDASKTAIAANIDRNLKRLRVLDDLNTRRAAANAISQPAGSQPGIPLIGIVAAIVAFIIMCVTFGFSGGAGAVFLIITIAIIAYVVWTFMKRSQWTQAQNRYDWAQRELADINHKLAVQPPLTEIIWM